MFSLTRRALIAAAAAIGMALAVDGSAFAADKLVIGSYPANPPWQNKKEDGTFEGFEVDMINEIAKRIGMEPEISDYGFQALFAATASGRIDVAISSISITPERLQSQSFTQGHYDSNMALVGRKDNPTNTLADMKGKTIGAIAASVGEKWIADNKDQYGIADSKSYQTQQDLLLDLQAGRIDGAVGDVAGFQFAFVKMPDLAVKEEIKTGDQFGLMMKKGHPLLEKVNAAITEMKKDGTMAAIHKKWFGVDPSPDSSTVQERPLPQ